MPRDHSLGGSGWKAEAAGSGDGRAMPADRAAIAAATGMHAHEFRVHPLPREPHPHGPTRHITHAASVLLGT
jgi:hypothetical protein